MTIHLIIGAPGSGKSYKIRQFAESLNYKCHIFAPTNSAAQIIKGCTPWTLSDKVIKPFDYNIIIIDEIFMFNYDIIRIVKKCFDLTKDGQLYMYGDPYQLKNGSYFYDAFKDDEYTTEYLNEIHRSEDQELTNLLLEYRINKRADEFPFQQINKQQIKQYLYNGYTLLTGTHKAIQYYSKFAPYEFNSLDGRLWYKGQKVYTINRYGNCEQFDYIEDFKNNNFILKSGRIVSPFVKNGQITYLLNRGDIITVNLSQGQTLKGVILDLANFFEFGSYYTAISRVKSKKNIFILTYPIQPIEADLSNMFV